MNINNFSIKQMFLQRRFVPSKWKLAYYSFFLLQILHICLFIILKPERPEGALLFCSGVVNIILYTMLLLSDIRYGIDDINPFWFYIGMSILRMGIAVLYVAGIVWTHNYEAIRLGRVDASSLLMDGHLLLLVGDFCLIAGYFSVCNFSLKKRHFLLKKGHPLDLNIYKAGLILTLCGFGIRIVQTIVSLGGLGQIVGYVSDYGVPAGVFLMLDACRRKKLPLLHPQVRIPLVLLAISVISGLSSYMKSDILITLFPLFFILIDSGFGRYGVSRKRFKLSLKSAAAIVLFAYFFLFTVSTYSDLRRSRAWEHSGGGSGFLTQTYTPGVTTDLLLAIKASIPGTDAFSKYHNFPADGVWHMFNRLSVTSWAATSIKLVKMHGTIQDSIASAILLSITPRILYPNKPSISWGREVAVALGQARSYKSATTATALTMFGFQYWWGGHLNVIIMAFLSGAGFALVYLLFTKDWRINPASALVIMALTYNGLHWKESDVLGGIPFYLYMLIVFFPLSIFIRRHFSASHRKTAIFKDKLPINTARK